MNVSDAHLYFIYSFRAAIFREMIAFVRCAVPMLDGG